MKTSENIWIFSWFYIDFSTNSVKRRCSDHVMCVYWIESVGFVSTHSYTVTVMWYDFPIAFIIYKIVYRFSIWLDLKSDNFRYFIDQNHRENSTKNSDGWACLYHVSFSSLTTTTIRTTLQFSCQKYMLIFVISHWQQMNGFDCVCNSLSFTLYFLLLLFLVTSIWK